MDDKCANCRLMQYTHCYPYPFRRVYDEDPIGYTARNDGEYPSTRCEPNPTPDFLKAMSPPSLPASGLICVDRLPGWTDSRGFDCRWYAENGSRCIVDGTRHADFNFENMVWPPRMPVVPAEVVSFLQPQDPQGHLRGPQNHLRHNRPRQRVVSLQSNLPNSYPGTSYKYTD
jgi:hypothetical protein